MIEQPYDEVEQPFAYPRLNGKRCFTDLQVAAALDAGLHVHVLDQDGDWCLEASCDLGEVARTVVRAEDAA